MGNIVGSGQDNQKCVHGKVTGEKNQAGNLIKNVKVFTMTRLGSRLEMIQHVIGPEENQRACTLSRFPSVSANALILKISMFTLLETKANTFSRVKQ